MFRRALRYSQKTFGLYHRLKNITDRRIKPRIAVVKVAIYIFSLQFSNLGSLNNFSQKVTYPSVSTIARSADTMSLSDIRNVNMEIYKKARRSKILYPFKGKWIGIVDGKEITTSDYKKCSHCKKRKLRDKDDRLKYQYYHQFVAFILACSGFSITLDIEATDIDKNGQKYKKIEVVYGYKLVMLQSIEERARYIVTAALVPIGVHEDTLAYPLIKSAYDILGPGYIKTILADRGFFDGDLFRKLMDLSIDFIIPAKKNNEILSDMEGLSKIKGYSQAIGKKGELIKGFSDLTTLSSCLYKLNGILTEDGHGFITSLKVNTEKRLAKTFNLYSKRWDIDNYGFRELKEYWGLKRLPGKKFNTVYMHTFLILTMFNTVEAYKSNKRNKFVQKGFLSLVKTNFSYTDEMIIYRDGYVGIFSLKEFLLLMDLPPPSEEAIFRIIKYPQGKGKLW